MSDKKTPEENGSEEKIVIPSNEEVLEVVETSDEIDVIDVGNKESAKIIENWSEAKQAAKTRLCIPAVRIRRAPDADSAWCSGTGKLCATNASPQRFTGNISQTS